MCTCVKFCWNRHLLNTTIIGLLALGGRELFVLVLHFAGTDSYLTLLWLVQWHWRAEVMCACITFCLTRQLFNSILMGPMAFGKRELYVVVLHSVPLHFSSVCWSLVWDLRIEILLKNNYLIFRKRVADIRRLSMTMGYCTSLQWMV